MDLICTTLLKRCNYKVNGYWFEFNCTNKLDIKLSELQNLRPQFPQSLILPLHRDLKDTGNNTYFNDLYEEVAGILITKDRALIAKPWEHSSMIMNHTTRSGSPFKEIEDCE